MTRIYGKIAFSLFFLGACDLPLDSQRQGIIGGTPSAPGSFEATGALVGFGQNNEIFVACTGTLIAPDVVLTAAHCVHPQITYGQVPSFTLALDGTTVSSSQVVTGASATPHSGFDPQSQPPTGLSQVDDVGLLFLSEPITEVEPARLPTVEEAEQIVNNAPIDIVGYGYTVSGDQDNYGVKYEATSKLADVAAYEVQVGAPGDSQNCQGDSGGPAFLDVGDGLRLISMVSRSAVADTNDCSKGGIHTRADAYLSWIDSQVDLPCGSGLAAPCEEDPSGTEDPEDPNAPNDPDMMDSGEASGGCAVSKAPQSTGLLLLGLFLVPWLRRRRRS